MNNDMVWERDRSFEFEEQARDLLNALADTLESLQIPYFFSACIKNEKDKDGRYHQEYVRAGRTPASYGRTMDPLDTESRYINYNGAEIKNPAYRNPAYHDGSLYADEISHMYAVANGAEVLGRPMEDLGSAPSGDAVDRVSDTSFTKKAKENSPDWTGPGA